MTKDRIANTVLKKNEIKALIPLDFKIYSKAIAMMTAWYLWKYTQTDKWGK